MVPFQQRLLDADLAFSTAFAEGVESVKEGIDLVWEFKTQQFTMPGVEEVVFGFLAEMPLFRAWNGERTPKRLNTGEYSVKQGDFEFSYALKRNDIKYDRIGVIANMHFRASGIAQRRFPSDLINDLQKAGKTSTCYDGQFFYDTDHPVGFNGIGATTFQNLWTGMALNTTNVFTRYQYMTQLVDANGKRMGIRPNVLEYGPGDLQNVRNTLDAEIIGMAVNSSGVFSATSSVVGAAGVTNVARGLLIPQYNPDLEDGVWYLHDTRMTKPFMLVEETPPTGLISRVDPQDPHVWDFKEYLYGAEATAVGAYGLPHTSTRCEE